jgi:hypothetical protein
MNYYPTNYTCKDYRGEMMLISLNKKLSSNQLSDKERNEIKQNIRKLEKEMGLI